MTPSLRARSCLVQYKNCRLLRNHQLVWDDLWVRDGRIEDPRKLFWEERVASDVQVDCGGCIVSPGFIDTQINGGFGVDFSSEVDNIIESVDVVSKKILAHGVTAFCPTVITSSHETYKKISARSARLCKQDTSSSAKVLGLHLEGPFISREKRGAHPENLIQSYEKNGFSDVEKMYTSLDNVSIVTLAPEIPYSDQVIQELTKRGIQVSLGHSMANLEQGERAVQNGATFITHLFNAMLPFHHRDPGIVGLLASSNIPAGRTVYYGVIADGIHTNPSALRIAYKTHPDGVVLVTDAVAPMGLEPGRHNFGNITVEVNEGKAYVAGTTTLAGSVATMDGCVRIFKTSARCSTEKALEAATLHPAKMLGIEKERGTLDYGAVADFVMLDDDLNVLSTFLAGRKAYSRNLTITEHDKAGSRLSREGMTSKRTHNGDIVKETVTV